MQNDFDRFCRRMRGYGMWIFVYKQIYHHWSTQYVLMLSRSIIALISIHHFIECLKSKNLKKIFWAKMKYVCHRHGFFLRVPTLFQARIILIKCVSTIYQFETSSIYQINKIWNKMKLVMLHTILKKKLIM